MEIMCDILEVVSSGMERPTHIIYKANISWRVFNNCLKSLTAKGLVVKENDGKRDIYHVTEQGYKVLNEYKELRAGLLASGRAETNNFARDF